MSIHSLEKYGKQTISVGPWGGQDGSHWDDGVYSTVRQLEIVHGAIIDSIRIEYDNNGTSVWSERHGGSGGAKVYKVRLDWPDEFLTSLHGYYGSLQEWGPVFVLSLTFESNKRTFGPYGIEEGTWFSSPTSRYKIVGFHGNCGLYLDSIGVKLEPLQTPIASNSILCPQGYSTGVCGNEKFYGYSIIQGSFGTNYDLIVAIRGNDNYNNSSQINLSRQTSNDISDREPKNEIAKIKRVPSEDIVKGVVTSGPWGGNGGSLFNDGVYDGVRQISLSRNVCIVSIRVCYEQNGQQVWGSRNGGTGSFKSDKIMFDYPSEVLTHITGYHGPTMILGPDVIKSLTFHTTKGEYGPYGEEQGQFFSTKLKEGSVIAGFHGRKGLFIDAIGVHVLKGKVLPASTSQNQNSAVSPSTSGNKKYASNPPSAANNQTTESTYKIDNLQWDFKIGNRVQTEERLVKDPAPYGPGPWGGDGGKPWDDGVFTGIKQIILTKTDAICCIEIEYDRNGQSVWSVKHGGSSNGQPANQVKLEYPNEVLTCISGYYSPVRKDYGTKVIQSLTFHSSRRKYGPFGEEMGSYFSSGTTRGKVVGFHGRSSIYLDAIGVHMQHWLGNQRQIKPSSIMKIFN